MKTVYFYEAFEEEADCLRSYLPAHISADFSNETIQEQDSSVPPARIISVRTQSVIPPEWAGKVTAILARTTGYDHMQAYQKAADQAVPCGHLPLYCARAVAEQAMLLWTALIRKLPLQEAQFDSFNRDGLTGRECKGKNLLVVGVGNIGHDVVAIGRGLGMNVEGVDIVERHGDVEYVDFSAALKRADVLVCAMNLTADNRDYFNYEALKHCRPGLIFVNISRGECSPAAGLVRLLDERRLAGVGLDVYNNEPALAVSARSGDEDTDSETQAVRRLAGMASAILTPHNAFNTEEAVQRKSQQSVEQITAFLTTGSFKWPVPTDH
jgi:D-lactate dehydrogenase